MKKNRISMFMDATFKYGDEEFETSVYIPFPIFVEAFRRYCDGKFVTIDATDNAIWNLLVDLNCLDSLESDEELQKLCQELYKGSIFEEEDYEVWKDEYEMDHNLGEYAIKDEED